MKKPSSKNKEVIKESQEEAFIIVNETVIGNQKKK